MIIKISKEGYFVVESEQRVSSAYINTHIRENFNTVQKVHLSPRSIEQEAQMQKALENLYESNRNPKINLFIQKLLELYSLKRQSQIILVAASYDIKIDADTLKKTLDILR